MSPSELNTSLLLCNSNSSFTISDCWDSLLVEHLKVPRQFVLFTAYNNHASVLCAATGESITGLYTKRYLHAVFPR